MGHHRGHPLCCRCVRALRVLSLMCMCSCFHMGSYSHCTHEASRKSVYHPSLATRGQFGSGFDLIMITTAKSSRLLLLHATTLQSATVLYRPTHIGSPAASPHRITCFVSLLSSFILCVLVSLHRTLRSCLLVCGTCLLFCCLRCLAPPDHLLELLAPPCLLPSPALLVCPPID